MAIRSFIRVLLLTIGLHPFCKGTAGSRPDLPVLPFPQHAVQGKKQVFLSYKAGFDAPGLEKEPLARLSENWEEFRREQPGVTSPMQVGLVLLEEKAPARIAELAAPYLDSLGREGYILDLRPEAATIAARTETGLFYGLQTLKQLVRGDWDTELFIADWPAFETRVIYDDISRGPISTVDYVREQIRRLAGLKVNYLSFYIEHVVQPLSHPDFAPENGKLTIAQIRELSQYAEKYHMQLIGSFQSFGHFEKILALPQYAAMGETNTLISPLDPTARQFLENVIGELCDAFNAPWFNVNCDETFDLNKGKSKAYIDSIGPARFYADHLKFLYDIVRRRGKKMMMWGDIALQHPEIPDMLPRDIVYLTWEYGDQESYDRWIRPFEERGLEFMVCPGILNSYRMFPDIVMARSNIKGFLEAGKQHGATGAFTTIWDDGGTYLFSGDWYGVYAAAEKSWNLASPPEASFNRRYSQTAYGTGDTHYVEALFKLMALRKLTLTYNLNELIWSQQLLSRQGKPLQLNNTSIPEANQILGEASALIRQAKAVRHHSDLVALELSIDQYRLIMDLRSTLAAIADAYRRAASATSPAREKLLSGAVAEVQRLTVRLDTLLERFQTAWRKENQEYWLDVVSAGYESKSAALRELQQSLEELVRTRPAALPPADRIGLDITETPYTYFQNWLLSGPFPSQKGSLPGFLYSEGNEYNQPPTPGAISVFEGKNYRWRKFASPDGGLIDLEDYYNTREDAVAYAYCNIRITEEEATEAYLAAPPGTELFCNGEKAATIKGTGDVEERVSLRLKKGGPHHLLLKIPAAGDTPWRFSFRLGNGLEVIHHKHKYQTNSKNKIYEAE